MDVDESKTPPAGTEEMLFANCRKLIATPESDAELIIFPLPILIPEIGGFLEPHELSKRMNDKKIMYKSALLFSKLRQGVHKIFGINITLDGYTLAIRCYKAVAKQIMEIGGKIAFTFYVEEAKKLDIDVQHAVFAYISYPRMHTHLGIEVGNWLKIYTSKSFKVLYERNNYLAKNNPRLVAMPVRRFYSDMHQILSIILPNLAPGELVPEKIANYNPHSFVRFQIPEELFGLLIDDVLVCITGVEDSLHNVFNVQALPRSYASYNEITRTVMVFRIQCDKNDGNTPDMKRRKTIMTAFVHYLKTQHAIFTLDETLPWEIQGEITLHLLFYMKKTLNQMYPKEMLDELKKLKPACKEMAKKFFAAADENGGIFVLPPKMGLPKDLPPPDMEPLLVARHRSSKLSIEED